MRFRTMTTGLSPLPRARVTLPLLGLLVAGVAAGRVYDRKVHPNEAAILGMASDRGLSPIMAKPGLGVEVFQWDPELADIAPFDIGTVVDPHALYQGSRYVLVRRPHKPGLYIGIHQGEMRYWIRTLSP